MVSLKTPDELVKLMGQTYYEFHDAIMKLRTLEKDWRLRQAQMSVILSAKRHNLITNENLRKHFKTCIDDPKFRLTNDLIANFTYLEHRELMEEYSYYDKIRHQAEKEYEILSSQLIWHQSKNKMKVAELINLKE